MRLGTTALVASALTGMLYLSAHSAAALPAPSRADVGAAKTPGLTQEVRRLRGFYRGWGYRPYRYRPYRYYGYGYGYPAPYYYRPYYYGGYGYNAWGNPYVYGAPRFYYGY